MLDLNRTTKTGQQDAEKLQTYACQLFSCNFVNLNSNMGCWFSICICIVFNALWASCVINSIVDFPLNSFDLSPWMSAESKAVSSASGQAPRLIYELFGVTNHSGTSLFGHCMGLNSDWMVVTRTRVSCCFEF